MSAAPASAAAAAASAAPPAVPAALNAAASSPSVAVAAPPAPFTPAFSIGELQRGGAQLLSMCADLECMNACAFCMLRFANVKQERAYQQTSEWLQQYCSVKLGWSYRWSESGCPLCLDVLLSARRYWDETIRPSLLTDEGQWRVELETFSLQISEPILAKIRQFAAFQVLKAKYSRLQNGCVDLKDAVRWQLSALIIGGVPGTTAKFSPIPCDFGFQLSFTSWVPDAEYACIVRTLPLNEQAATVRAPGDFTTPASNTPPPDPKGPPGPDGLGRFKKRGKKSPRQDAMGQKTVMASLPRVKPEEWHKLDMFKPVREREAKLAAAAAAAAAAVVAADSTAAAAAPAVAAPTAAAPTAAAASSAMDTSSSSTTTSEATAASSSLVVPADYPLPPTVYVPPPTLTLAVHREPVLLCGYYRKFYRALSQSIWKLAAIKAAASAAAVAAGAPAADAAAAGESAAAEAAESAAAVNDDEDEDENAFPDDEFGDDDDGDDDDGDGLTRRMTDSSVEEEIVRHVLQHFEAQGYKFHSSGREDMDVRMLGNGRMFFLELQEAKRVPKGAEFYAQLQSTINANTEYVEVLGLHLSSKAEFNQMKQGVASKRKSYRCVVWVEQALTGPTDPRLALLDNIKDMALAQKTPVRVLHRRSLLTRAKTVYSAHVEYVNPHWIYLDVLTSAGTYVKEFVHGDRGRTMPNVGHIIGCRTEIIQLDVTGFDSGVHVQNKNKGGKGKA